MSQKSSGPTTDLDILDVRYPGRAQRDQARIEEVLSNRHQTFLLKNHESLQTIFSNQNERKMKERVHQATATVDTLARPLHRPTAPRSRGRRSASLRSRIGFTKRSLQQALPCGHAVSPKLAVHKKSIKQKSHRIDRISSTRDESSLRKVIHRATGHKHALILSTLLSSKVPDLVLRRWLSSNSLQCNAWSRFHPNPHSNVTRKQSEHQTENHQNSWIWRQCRILDYITSLGMFRIRWNKNTQLGCGDSRKRSEQGQSNDEEKFVFRSNLRFMCESEDDHQLLCGAFEQEAMEIEESIFEELFFADLPSLGQVDFGTATLTRFVTRALTAMDPMLQRCEIHRYVQSELPPASFAGSREQKSVLMELFSQVSSQFARVQASSAIQNGSQFSKYTTTPHAAQVVLGHLPRLRQVCTSTTKHKSPKVFGDDLLICPKGKVRAVAQVLVTSAVRFQRSALVAIQRVVQHCNVVLETETFWTKPSNKAITIRDFDCLQRSAQKRAEFALGLEWRLTVTKIVESAISGCEFFTCSDPASSVTSCRRADNQLLKLVNLVECVMRCTITELVHRALHGIVGLFTHQSTSTILVDQHHSDHTECSSNTQEPLLLVGVRSVDILTTSNRSSEDVFLQTESDAYEMIESLQGHLTTTLELAQNISSVQALILASNEYQGKKLGVWDLPACGALLEAAKTKISAIVNESFERAHKALLSFNRTHQWMSQARDCERYASSVVILHRGDHANISGALAIHAQREHDITRDMPRHIWTSAFTLDLSQVKREFLETNTNLRNSIYSSVLERGNQACFAVTDEFNTIARRLLQTPKTVRDIAAMTKFLAALPLSVEMLHANLDHVIADFDLLESEHWTISSKSLMLLWSASVLPKRTHGRMIICQTQLAALREDMLSNISRQLALSRHRFDELVKQFNILNQQLDVTNAHTNHLAASRLGDALNQVCLNAQLLTEHQHMLETKPADISDLLSTKREARLLGLIWNLVSYIITARKYAYDTPCARITATHLDQDSIHIQQLLGDLLSKCDQTNVRFANEFRSLVFPLDTSQTFESSITVAQSVAKSLGMNDAAVQSKGHIVPLLLMAWISHNFEKLRADTPLIRALTSIVKKNGNWDAISQVFNDAENDASFAQLNSMCSLDKHQVAIVELARDVQVKNDFDRFSKIVD